MPQLRSVSSSRKRLGPIIALSHRCPAIAGSHSSLEGLGWGCGGGEGEGDRGGGDLSTKRALFFGIYKFKFYHKTEFLNCHVFFCVIWKNEQKKKNV